MNNEKKDITIYDLENDVEGAIKTMDVDYDIGKLKNEIEIDERRQDALQEIIDGIVPIYNYDLLTVAGTELWLGEAESESGATNAFQCLREAIYHHLYKHAMEIINKE